jgi:hypothetical protein
MLRQLMIRDLNNQEPVIEELNAAVDAITKNAPNDARHAVLLEKQQEMNNGFNVVRVLAHDRILQLHDRLHEVSCFLLILGQCGKKLF